MRDVKQHPMAVAARFNDARAEEVGLSGTLSGMGLDVDDMMHIARQRALRAVCVSLYQQPLSEELARKIIVDPQASSFLLMATTVALDGMAIGWEAKRIADYDNSHEKEG